VDGERPVRDDDGETGALARWRRSPSTPSATDRVLGLQAKPRPVWALLYLRNEVLGGEIERELGLSKAGSRC